MNTASLRALCALVLIGGGAAAQGTLSLTVGASPQTFSSPQTVPCGATTISGLTDLLKTEPLVITLTTVPAVINPPPGVGQPRRFQLWFGVEQCPSIPVNIGGSFSNVFIQL